VDAIGRFAARHRWPGLRSSALIERERVVGGGDTSVERVHEVTRLETDAKRFGALVRGHWGIENQVHWVLDIAFREDECRIRKDQGPANMGLLRKLAFNLLKRETSLKGGVTLSL
jgi:predicted transposase YbfD/YdcC